MASVSYSLIYQWFEFSPWSWGLQLFDSVCSWKWESDVDNCAICRNVLYDICVECQSDDTSFEQGSYKCPLAWLVPAVVGVWSVIMSRHGFTSTGENVAMDITIIVGFGGGNRVIRVRCATNNGNWTELSHLCHLILPHRPHPERAARGWMDLSQDAVLALYSTLNRVIHRSVNGPRRSTMSTHLR